MEGRFTADSDLKNGPLIDEVPRDISPHLGLLCSQIFHIPGIFFSLPDSPSGLPNLNIVCLFVCVCVWERERTPMDAYKKVKKLISL